MTTTTTPPTCNSPDELVLCGNCGRYGWHQTDRCPETRPPDTEWAAELRDAHRRIRNILDVYPAASWDLAESEAVLAALAGIVRGRQAACDVIESARRG